VQVNREREVDVNLSWRFVVASSPSPASHLAKMPQHPPQSYQCLLPVSRLTPTHPTHHSQG